MNVVRCGRSAIPVAGRRCGSGPRIHLSEAEGAALAGISPFLGSVYRRELTARVDRPPSVPGTTGLLTVL